MYLLYVLTATSIIAAVYFLYSLVPLTWCMIICSARLPSDFVREEDAIERTIGSWKVPSQPNELQIVKTVRVNMSGANLNDLIIVYFYYFLKLSLIRSFARNHLEARYNGLINILYSRYLRP